MVVEGKRKEEWSTKNLLPMSGKLIPEFDRRRNIRDMFSRKPSLSWQKSFAEPEEIELRSPSTSAFMTPPPLSNDDEAVVESNQKGAFPSDSVAVASPGHSAGSKRAERPEVAMPATKRTKSGSQPGSTNGASKGQRSLKGFFQSKSLATNGSGTTKDGDTVSELPPQPTSTAVPENGGQRGDNGASSLEVGALPHIGPGESSLVATIDEASAEASKQSWGKLFSKPISPKCEHGEPCKIMLTKKPGVNCGRSFWMCARPLGPSGNKEKKTEWRCSMFIWASDWTGTGNS